MANKYFAFSFDDGTPNDERMVPLLNKYSIKATFHLNAALIPLDGKIGPWNRLPLSRLQNLYSGHEIAAHGYTHPDLTQCTDDQIREELEKDIEGLNRYFSQETRGFAYPYGTFNDSVIQQLKKTLLVYARTIRDTFCFDIPKDPYLLDPTCHFNHGGLMELADKFLKEGEDGFFLIWGHSYELNTEEDWDRFESFLKKIAFKDHVFYGSILDCLNEMKR